MPVYQFGERSLINLDSAHYGLQCIIREALSMGLIDFAIIEGHRNKGRQNRLYKLGRSRLQWPESKHNKTPSEAVDAAPYVNGKISWQKEHCIFLAGIILTCAKKWGIPLRWGGNWDMDGEPVTDQDFQDLVHYEVVTD